MSERERERDRDAELLFLKGMTGALAPFSCLVFYIYQPEAVKHFFPILKPIEDIIDKSKAVFTTLCFLCSLCMSLIS